MKDSIRQLADSIDVLSSRAALSSGEPALVAEINEVLSTGYLRALQADGELRRLERRIRELDSEPADASTERERQTLFALRRRTTAETMYLRARLEVLRAQFVRLRMGAGAPKS